MLTDYLRPIKILFHALFPNKEEDDIDYQKNLLKDLEWFRHH